jgi:CRP/FNR family transcriptional regulator, cyclic AMP receptor protein
MTAADDTLADYLLKHPVFEGLEPSQLALIVSYASETDYKPGMRVFQRDFDAHEFFIVRAGKVAIEVPAIDGESLKIQTVGDGSLLGWSWFIPPYRWSFDARAVTPSKVISINGDKLRTACDEDPKLGYLLVKRFAVLMAERLNAARIEAMRHYAG